MWDSTSGDQPIGAIYLDRSGLVVVGAAGATNCQGKGGAVRRVERDDPARQGQRLRDRHRGRQQRNRRSLADAQTDAYVELCAALCDAYDLDPAIDVVAHFEWTSRKIDPAGPSPYAQGSASWNMHTFRADVNACAGGGSAPEPEPGPGPSPAPTDESEDRMLGLVRLDSNPNAIYVMDGISARKVRSDEVDELTSNLQYNTGFRYYDLTTAERLQIRDVNHIPKRSEDQLQLWGIETTESTEQPG